MTTIHNLPKEVLLHVFFCYLEIETQVDFIYNISHVCQEWRKVCMDSSLWYRFDGTLPLHFLKKFCKDGYLRKTELLTFCDSENSLSGIELRNIYKNLPCLKSVNFSKVSWMLETTECNFFIELINHCPALCEIIVLEKRSKQPSCLDYKSLEDFLKIRGSKLTSLDFSNTSILGLRQLFERIASSCPNLEKLKARNVRNLSKDYFPIGSMQNGLQKLKVLQLGREIKMRNATSTEIVGFPNLDTFTRPSKRDFSLNDLRFTTLLMKSPKLRILDIRGCFHLTHTTLYNLPANNLEGLYVSCTKLYEHHRFFDILMKWGRSLVVLDVSKMKENRINHLFETLISLGSLQNLEILYLNNTAVTINTVKLIIQSCSKLKFLNLESCQAIGRDLKRKYRGQEIKDLLNQDIAEGMNT